MFTLTDMPVKFIGLLLLFTFSTLWSIYQLARRQNGLTLVSNLAHLAMSVVMLIMVPHTLWQPFSDVIPLPALVGFFGVFALWFVYLGVRGLNAGAAARQHGWHALGHGGMFGAMTWHLAAMMNHHGHHDMDHGPDPGHGDGANGHEAMTEMTHGAIEHTSATSDLAMLIAVIGVPFMAYLLLAALGNLKNALAPSPSIRDHAGHASAGHGHYVAGNPRLASLADFSMNFGMFWMSTGLMTALLPFFSYF